MGRQGLRTRELLAKRRRLLQEIINQNREVSELFDDAVVSEVELCAARAEIDLQIKAIGGDHAS